MNTPYVTSIECQGIVNGERRLLYRLIYRRFGERSTEQITPLLEQLNNPNQLTDVGEWIIDCETGDELLTQVQALIP